MTRLTVLFVQQGDVLIKSRKIPSGARKREGSPVLAKGRRTSHEHIAEGREIELYEKSNTLYLRAPYGVTVHHPIHKSIELSPGDYQIGQIREYDHFGERAHRVRIDGY